MFFKGQEGVTRLVSETARSNSMTKKNFVAKLSQLKNIYIYIYILIFKNDTKKVTFVLCIETYGSSPIILGINLPVIL